MAKQKNRSRNKKLKKKSSKCTEKKTTNEEIHKTETIPIETTFSNVSARANFNITTDALDLESRYLKSESDKNEYEFEEDELEIKSLNRNISEKEMAIKDYKKENIILKLSENKSQFASMYEETICDPWKTIPKKELLSNSTNKELSSFANILSKCSGKIENNNQSISGNLTKMDSVVLEENPENTGETSLEMLARAAVEIALPEAIASSSHDNEVNNSLPSDFVCSVVCKPMKINFDSNKPIEISVKRAVEAAVAVVYTQNLKDFTGEEFKEQIEIKSSEKSKNVKFEAGNESLESVKLLANPTDSEIVFQNVSQAKIENDIAVLLERMAERAARSQVKPSGLNSDDNIGELPSPEKPTDMERETKFLDSSSETSALKWSKTISDRTSKNESHTNEWPEKFVSEKQPVEDILITKEKIFPKKENTKKEDKNNRRKQISLEKHFEAINKSYFKNETRAKKRSSNVAFEINDKKQQTKHLPEMYPDSTLQNSNLPNESIDSKIVFNTGENEYSSTKIIQIHDNLKSATENVKTEFSTEKIVNSDIHSKISSQCLPVKKHLKSLDSYSDEVSSTGITKSQAYVEQQVKQLQVSLNPISETCINMQENSYTKIEQNDSIPSTSTGITRSLYVTEYLKKPKIYFNALPGISTINVKKESVIGNVPESSTEITRPRIYVEEYMKGSRIYVPTFTDETNINIPKTNTNIIKQQTCVYKIFNINHLNKSEKQTQFYIGEVSNFDHTKVSRTYARKQKVEMEAQENSETNFKMCIKSLPQFHLHKNEEKPYVKKVSKTKKPKTKRETAFTSEKVYATELLNSLITAKKEIEQELAAQKNGKRLEISSHIKKNKTQTMMKYSNSKKSILKIDSSMFEESCMSCQNCTLCIIREIGWLKVSTIFNCEEEKCESIFKCLSSYTMHQLMEHKKLALYTCNVCVKRFCTIYAFKKHERLEHLDLGFCSLCQHLFINIEEFEYHCGAHYEEDLIFVCNLCNEVFSHFEDFRFHFIRKKSFHLFDIRKKRRLEKIIEDLKNNENSSQIDVDFKLCYKIEFLTCPGPNSFLRH